MNIDTFSIDSSHFSVWSKLSFFLFLSSLLALHTKLSNNNQVIESYHIQK